MVVSAATLLAAPAIAGNKRYRDHRENDRNSYQTPATTEPANYVNQYLRRNLDVEDLTNYNMTIKLQKKVEKITGGDLSQNAVTQVALSSFSPQSVPVIGEIFRAFGRTEYSNAIALGPAGSGKSFLIDQLAALFSYGIVPEFLKAELGMTQDGFEVLREQFLGKTDVIMINMDLLSRDNTEPGKAFSSEEVRMRTTLTGLFEAARKEYQRTNSEGKRVGRRTIFVLDEVATLPALVQQTLKKVLDETGFRNPADPLLAQKDPGYAVLAMTTPDEYRQMVMGDSAVERRYKKVMLVEPTEAEALTILKNKSESEWSKIYGLSVSDEALRFIIRMRRILNSPPLAMPASVLAATNDLYLWRMQSGGASKEIGLHDAERFITSTIGLSDLWFEGPNGEPPFTGFAERVKSLVIGQDEVVERIADRLKAWARLNFGGEVPVFFLGGASGSGKDTLVNALNEVLFGHDGRHLMFSIGGIGGFGINAIIEGPPRGNHADGEQGLLVQALESGNKQGIITFNEGKDAPSAELEKLKVFIESGEIRPRGKDARTRPLRYPIFILGQWGEELFAGKSDAEIAKIYAGLSQAGIEEQFLRGKGDGLTGGVSRAMLDRAKKTGGVFLLSPVARNLYGKIVDLAVGRISKNLKARNNIAITVSPKLVEYIAQVSQAAGEGPRGLGATVIDFTETAISRAVDQGLPLRGGTVALDYVVSGESHDKKAPEAPQIVVKNADKTWNIPASELRRIKIPAACEGVLLGGSVTPPTPSH